MTECSRCVVAGVLCGWLLALSAEAPASLVEIDLAAPGDGLLTRDLETGLDWLDLSQTRGVSVEAILSGEGGWLSLGFEIANSAQVCDFFGRHGAVPVPCEQETLGAFVDGDVVTELRLLFQGPGTPYSGSIAGSFLDPRARFGTSGYFASYFSNDDFSRVSVSSVHPEGAPRNRSVFMVRPVPEPSSWLLTIASLLSLSWMRPTRPNHQDWV